MKGSTAIVDDRLIRARAGSTDPLRLRLPYSATSASEDDATIVAYGLQLGDYPQVDAYLKLIIENNIRARNLELPTKLLLNIVAAKAMDLVSARTGTSMRTMLAKAMASDGGSDIPPTTRDAYDAVEKLGGPAHWRDLGTAGLSQTPQ